MFRAPMGSTRESVADAVEHALTREVCGVGGILRPAPGDLDDALARLSDTHGERAAARLRRFAQVPDGAFVWTRSVDGYVLGRLAGPWRYDDSPGARAVDLVHVRACSWLPDPVAEAEVPAGTLRTFARGGRNFQQTHGAGISDQTRACGTNTAELRGQSAPRADGDQRATACTSRPVTRPSASSLPIRCSWSRASGEARVVAVRVGE